MIRTVRELISTLWMIENELKISRETIHKILMEDIRKWKICTWFVPHCLTNEQKALRLQAYSVYGWWSFLAWLNCIRWWDPVFPVWSPNKKTKHGMALTRLSKTQKISISKV
jgi:hypothetical protein